MRARRVPLRALLVGVVTLAGCGKTMTKEECDRVRAHLRKVWDSETEATAPEEGPRSARASNAIKSVGDKMEADWAALCERELEGRKIDEREVECILSAKTVAEIQKCGTAKK